MDAYKQRAEEVIKSFGSDSKSGLDEKQAAESVRKYGANVLTKAKHKSLFIRIVEGLTEPMMIILLVALVITLCVNIIKVLKGDRFDYVECIGIIVAISLSVTLTIVMEGRSAKAFEALSRIGENVLIKTIRKGVLQNIPQDKLCVGDIVRFEVGDKIPVDCRLIKTSALEVDESPLTGESVPVKKNADFVFEGVKLPLAERKNMVYGGCYVAAGSCEAIVTGVGDSTEIGSIAKELRSSEGDLTPLQRKLDKLGKKIAVLGGVAAGLVFVIQLVLLAWKNGINFESVQEIFITSIVLIVATVPEGLPTIVAVSLALNVIKMAKQNALVKKMVACETVGSVSVICSDKTGTLTENKMTISYICTAKGDITPEHLTDPYIIKNFCINTSANVNLNPDKTYTFIGSPTECAMLVAYNKTAPTKTYLQVRSEARVLYSYPFSSEKKRMTTVLSEGGQAVAYTKGAPEIILEMCEADGALKRRLLEKIAGFQADAKRVIGLAHGAVRNVNYETGRDKVESSLIFDGFVVISDPVRKEVYDAVEQCRGAGVKVKMLTGDNVVTAKAIARELKIISDNSEVYHADDIDRMSDAELIKKLDHIKVVARSTPLTKLRVVRALKEKGEIVAVTGDGINDAPAIKQADVGIAMGIAGTEVSKEASDIVLLDDSFSTIVKSVQWGRGIYENFQRFIMFQLTVNLSAVLVTIICIFAGTDAPFNALQLLWINLIMDGPPALTLGLEPISDDLMQRRPIERNASIVTKRMMFRIVLNGIFIAAFMISQVINNFMNVWVEKERTVIFTLFVVFQLFNAFNARELKEESIFSTLHKNKIMLAVMLITFALQIIITQFGGRVFNTVPLDFTDWLKILGSGLAIVLFNELYKLIIRLIKPAVRRNL